MPLASPSPSGAASWVLPEKGAESNEDLTRLINQAARVWAEGRAGPGRGPGQAAKPCHRAAALRGRPAICIGRNGHFEGQTTGPPRPPPSRCIPDTGLRSPPSQAPRAGPHDGSWEWGGSSAALSSSSETWVRGAGKSVENYFGRNTVVNGGAVWFVQSYSHANIKGLGRVAS